MHATLACSGGSAAILLRIALPSSLLGARWALLLAVLALSACPEASERQSPQASLPVPSASALPPEAPPAVSSAVVAVERRLQSTRLRLGPQRWREPRLAFGKNMLGQVLTSELRVLDGASGEQLLSQPLEGARLVVALADGSLLAFGSRNLVRVDAFTRKASTLARVVLLPGAELHPDAVAPDRIWIFDGRGRSADAGTHPMLSSIQLDPKKTGLLLPDRSVDLELPAGGVLGQTREGVWLYVSGKSVERFGPSGARLAKLRLPGLPAPVWWLPSRRLDQCFVVEESGRVSRAVVTPSFRQLAGVQLAGAPLTAAVGDEGRLLAVVVVTGEGPRFELQLLDAELKELARVPLPGEAPTGGQDWVKVVTQNQGVAVASTDGRVAVGGPERVAVFDAQGKSVFSIPSR